MTYRVTLREVLDELRYGKGNTLPEGQKRITDDTLVRIINYLEAKKAAKPRTPRVPKNTTKLYSLDEWETLWCGKLDVPLMDTWATEKNLCKRQLAQLIEEFRTEMISKGKRYADFKAAFQVYLNKGYLSKRIEQIKAPVQQNKWGNTTSTRGLSL